MREKMRKGRKVAKHCVFPMVCGSGGSKSRLAKAAGAEAAGQRRDEKLHAVVERSTFPSQNVQNTRRSVSKSRCTKHTTFGPLLEVEMLKKCTPLRREAHFQVKMHKAHQVRTTFGTWDVEKVHAVVARSTFPSQNVQSTPGADGPLLALEMLKKCTPLWREAHFQVKMLKTLGFRTTFVCSDLVSRGRRKGLCTVSKVSKTWGFCGISKNDGRRGTFEEDLQRSFRLAGAVQETYPSEMLGGQGADFLRGVAFWSIRYVDFLRWFCVTGAALCMTWHLFFGAGAVLSTGGV